MHTAKTIPVRMSGAATICTWRVEDSTSVRNVPDRLAGNVTLREILAFENISKSQGYKLRIVPKYGKNGIPIEDNTVPPFPWLRLPPPIVRTGKKLWDAEAVMDWHFQIHARALSMDSSTSSDDLMQREVLHGR
jgi:hypothetical protein